MGSVYQAVDESLGRQVALKVLRPDFARNAEAVQRLFNEARAVNLIVHPGLVQISEFGQMPDGSAYLVMEYLDGETLTERLVRSGGRMSEDEATQLAGQLASALATAHSKGVVHRDLFPQSRNTPQNFPEIPLAVGTRWKVAQGSHRTASRSAVPRSAWQVFGMKRRADSRPACGAESLLPYCRSSWSAASMSALGAIWVELAARPLSCPSQ